MGRSFHPSDTAHGIGTQFSADRTDSQKTSWGVQHAQETQPRSGQASYAAPRAPTPAPAKMNSTPPPAPVYEPWGPSFWSRPLPSAEVLNSAPKLTLADVIALSQSGVDFGEVPRNRTHFFYEQNGERKIFQVPLAVANDGEFRYWVAYATNEHILKW